MLCEKGLHNSEIQVSIKIDLNHGKMICLDYCFFLSFSLQTLGNYTKLKEEIEQGCFFYIFTNSGEYFVLLLFIVIGKAEGI